MRSIKDEKYCGKQHKHEQQHGHYHHDKHHHDCPSHRAVHGGMSIPQPATASSINVGGVGGECNCCCKRDKCVENECNSDKVINYKLSIYFLVVL